MAYGAVESDPAVFTELVTRVGVQGVEVAEIESFAEATLAKLGHVYAFIFLFKWDAGMEAELERIRSTAEATEETDPNIYFAKQVVQDACATQAIVNVLMNIPEGTEFVLGEELSKMKTFTADFDMEMKGLSIGNSEILREAHNSFRPPASHLLPEKSSSSEGEAFHYIAYMPIRGRVYELDGLAQGPRAVCAVEDGAWIHQTIQVIQERMRMYQGSEERFSLQAIIEDKSQVIRRDIAALEKEMQSLEELHQSVEVRRKILELTQQIAKNMAALRDEEDKRKAWKMENVYRRTDFTPFIFHCLKIMGKNRLLDQFI